LNYPVDRETNTKRQTTKTQDCTAHNTRSTTAEDAWSNAEFYVATISSPPHHNFFYTVQD